MSNEWEEKVAQWYEGKGFFVLHTGAPDFLLVRRDSGRQCIENSSPIAEVAFAEAKRGSNRLMECQRFWLDILSFLGAKCFIVRPSEDGQNVEEELYTPHFSVKTRNPDAPCRSDCPVRRSVESILNLGRPYGITGSSLPPTEKG